MAEISQDIKSIIESITFLSRDVLHVYGGVIFFMAWLIVFKRKKQLLCLSILLIGAAFNEVLDISFLLKRTNNINWLENISDIFNTIFLPIVLYFYLDFLDKKSK